MDERDYIAMNKRQICNLPDTLKCEHPYYDVKTYFDKQGEVVKCTKCDRVIERGYSSEVRNE